MIKKSFALIFSAFLLCLYTIGITAYADDISIDIVHTSDMSGTIFKNEEKGTIGYGNVLSVKEKLGNPIVIDCGNFLGDTSQKSVGLNEKTIYAMNKAGYKYAVLGYNDLKYTKAELDKLLSAADFEIISSNIKFGGEYAYKTTETKMINGVKTGIFAVTDCDSTDEFQITDPETEAGNCVKQLKSGGSKVIIAVVNTKNPDLSKKLASQNPDITMILESGTDNFLPDGNLISRTLMVNPGSKGNAIGVSAVKLSGGKLKSFQTSNYNLSNIKSVFPDTNTLEEELGSVQSEIDLMNNDVICVIPEELSNEGICSKSTPLGNFTADVLRAAVKSDIAFIRGSSVSGGLSENITGKALNELFYDNDDIVVKNVKGANIFKLVEISLNKIVADENGSVDYESSASDVFLQISGLKIEYNPSYPIGKRVIKITTDSGKKIGSFSNDEFTVAAPKELMNNYSEYLSGAEELETKENMIQLIRGYLSENKEFEVKNEERIIQTEAKKSYMWIVWVIIVSIVAAVIISYIVAKIVMFINKG